APEAKALWLAYEFPGNVRELRNIVIRLATRFPGQTVSAAVLAEEFDPGEPGGAPIAGSQPPTLPTLPIPPTSSSNDREALIENASNHLRGSVGFDLNANLLRWEDAYIEAARRLANGNISQAARLLGINRTTLYNRLDALAKERADGALPPSSTADPLN
ncbi:MAG: helix-turn-helix domain-containing protein, partial [Rhodocyclaceae bacterium]|nr:helix-turn-helix domain-containing protein [Rhodocyclaceae bacterium]